MYQHQPRVGFDHHNLDPFVSDPCRSLKVGWEICDARSGLPIVAGECKSILRGLAGVIQAMFGVNTGAGAGVVSLKDMTNTARLVAGAMQNTYYGLKAYNVSYSVNMPGAIHWGSGNAAVSATDYALGAEIGNSLTGAAPNEVSSAAWTTPVNTAAEHQHQFSVTVTPSTNYVLNELGVSSRYFYGPFSGGWQGLPGYTTGARFLVVRDTVAGGYNAVAGVPFTIRFTFRYLQTATAFIAQPGAKIIQQIISLNAPQGTYPDVLSAGNAAINLLDSNMLVTAANPPRIFTSDDATTLGMQTLGLSNAAGLIVANPIGIGEVFDAVKTRWNCTASRTYPGARMIRSVAISLGSYNGNGFCFAIAKLPAPVVIAPGDSHAFKFTFEIAV